MALMPFSIRVTVVAMAVTGRSLPSNGKLSKSYTKIVLYGKNARSITRSKLRKNCMVQDHNFLGGLDDDLSVKYPL